MIANGTTDIMVYIRHSKTRIVQLCSQNTLCILRAIFGSLPPPPRQDVHSNEFVVQRFHCSCSFMVVGEVVMSMLLCTHIDGWSCCKEGHRDSSEGSSTSISPSRRGRWRSVWTCCELNHDNHFEPVLN